MPGSEVQQPLAGDAPRAAEPRNMEIHHASIDYVGDRDGSWHSEEETASYSGSEDGCEWDSDVFSEYTPPPAGENDDDDDWEDDMKEIDFDEKSVAFEEASDFGVQSCIEEDDENDFGVESCDEDEDFPHPVENGDGMTEQGKLEKEYSEAYEKGLEEGRVCGYEDGNEDGLHDAVAYEYRDPFDWPAFEEGEEEEDSDSPEAPEAWERYERWHKGFMEGYDETYGQGYKDSYEAYDTIRDLDEDYCWLALQTVWRNVVSPGVNLVGRGLCRLRAMLVLWWREDNWVHVDV